MPRKPKGSAARRVGGQARRRREEQFKENEPTPISGKTGRGSRVELRDGRATLILPRPGKPPNQQDLTFLHSVPELMPMFAEAIRRYADSGVSDKTRRFVVHSFGMHFVCFLSQTSAKPLYPADLIDDSLWAAFINYLNRPREAGEPLHPATRASYFANARTILKALPGDTEWGQIACNILDHVPKNPWPGHSRKQNPVPVLPLDQFDSIVIAADAEFRQLLERRKLGQHLIEEGRERLAAGARNFRQDKALCLAAIADLYPGTIPSLDNLRANDRSLAHAVQHVHGVNGLSQYLYFSARDLVPLILLIAARTSFNPDLVLSIRWQNLKSWDTLDGREALRIGAYKPRAGQEQVKWLDMESEAEDGLSALLELVDAMTARLRSTLPEDQQDRLFVFMPQVKSKAPKAFTPEPGRASTSGDITWKVALRRYIEDHNLQQFTLRQLRPTRGSELFEATGDILVSRDELGHRSTQATWTHYTSDATRLRQMERLGQVLLVRERWLETDGTIDPRDAKPDPGAATPGFLCFDPHDSPRPGQIKGRPCTAYGECAACPLAAARNDEVAAAHYLGIRNAIVAGQHTMASQTWTTKWAPILAEHDAMLAALDNDVLARGESIKVSYPAVG